MAKFRISGASDYGHFQNMLRVWGPFVIEAGDMEEAQRIAASEAEYRASSEWNGCVNGYDVVPVPE